MFGQGKQFEVSEIPHQAEKVPERFPIVEVAETYYYEDTPPFQEGIIVHYFQGDPESIEKKNRYVLLNLVAGLNYIFKLDETSTEGQYGLLFKTAEYELATINLDDEGYQELAKTINAFLESVYLDKGSEMQEIHISPVDATYSAEEVEGCIEKILKSPENKLNREELMNKHNGFRIFDLYFSLFNKNFQDEHYNEKSRVSARSRFFKTMFRKNLPNWEVRDISGLTNDFDLIRRTSK